MSAEASFRTKYGFCHLFPDRIVLTEGEGTGTSQQLEKEQTPTRKTVYFICYTALCGGVAWFFTDQGKWPGAIVMGLIWLYFTYFFVRNFRVASPPVILRERVKGVAYKKASRLLGNPFFVILYEDDKGNTSKRYIAMQNIADGGEEEITQAIAVWKSAGLFNEHLS
jgi:hypothetical protein